MKKKQNSLMDVAMTRPEVGVIAVVVILVAIIGVVNPAFFGGANLMDVLRNTSYAFIIAAPMTLLMMSGGMDLTIGAVTSLGGVACAT